MEDKLLGGLCLKIVKALFFLILLLIQLYLSSHPRPRPTLSPKMIMTRQAFATSIETFKTKLIQGINSKSKYATSPLVHPPHSNSTKVKNKPKKSDLRPGHIAVFQT